VLRVAVDGGCVWFKASGPVQAFEPRLSAELFARWPDRVADFRFVHAIAWARQRDFLTPSERATFDDVFAHVLRRALRLT
jgi:hypothetical protein